jgi:hypothetical protein
MRDEERRRIQSAPFVFAPEAPVPGADRGARR